MRGVGRRQSRWQKTCHRAPTSAAAKSPRPCPSVGCGGGEGDCCSSDCNTTRELAGGNRGSEASGGVSLMVDGYFFTSVRCFALALTHIVLPDEPQSAKIAERLHVGAHPSRAHRLCRPKAMECDRRRTGRTSPPALHACSGRAGACPILSPRRRSGGRGCLAARTRSLASPGLEQSSRLSRRLARGDRASAQGRGGELVSLSD